MILKIINNSFCFCQCIFAFFDVIKANITIAVRCACEIVFSTISWFTNQIKWNTFNKFFVVCTVNFSNLNISNGSVTNSSIIIVNKVICFNSIFNNKCFIEIDVIICFRVFYCFAYLCGRFQIHRHNNRLAFIKYKIFTINCFTTINSYCFCIWNIANFLSSLPYLFTTNLFSQIIVLRNIKVCYFTVVNNSRYIFFCKIRNVYGLKCSSPIRL